MLFCLAFSLAAFPGAVPASDREGQEEAPAQEMQQEPYKEILLIGPDQKPAVPVGRGYARELLPLPNSSNTQDYTFLGWALEPGKKTDPDFLEYQRVRLLQNTTLYGVYYPNSEEKDLDADTFSSLLTERYKMVLFVGDSRFAHAGRAIAQELGEGFLASRHAFVLAQANITIEQFLEGTSRVNFEDLAAVLGNIPRLDQPAAVVVNLGTNNLRHVKNPGSAAEAFLVQLQDLADRLSAYHVKLFFMSVNPVSGEALARHNYTVYAFNRLIRESLPEGFTYIDSFSWLMKNGFTPRSCEDGVHYSLKTGKRVFDYAIRFLNTH